MKSFIMWGMSDSLIVSLSGFRGVVGVSMQPQLALEVGLSLGTWIEKGVVVVGTDSRTSGCMLKSALISGLTAVGIDVIDIGVVPTPTVQQMIRFHGAQAGVVVTASHNPVIWNGLKLMSDAGAFLDVSEFESFYKIFKDRTYALKRWDRMGQVRIDEGALDSHIDVIFQTLDPSLIQNANLSVVIDSNNGAGCEADRRLLDRLNVRYTLLNDEPTGVFSHNPEPVKEHLTEIQSVMASGDYDIGFAQDADADRLVIFDETGHFIGEDYSLAFCMDCILSLSEGTSKSVVVNLSTSKVIEALSTMHQARLVYTKIGESFVTQAIKSQNATVGGEGNGGIIYPKIGWGRDSLVGIVVALHYLAYSRKTVSEIVGGYPKYVMIREKIVVDDSGQVSEFLDHVKQVFFGESLILEDGVKVDFGDKWIHVRPSNTEPIIRLFAEAPTEHEARDLIDSVK